MTIIQSLLCGVSKWLMSSLTMFFRLYIFYDNPNNFEETPFPINWFDLIDLKAKIFTIIPGQFVDSSAAIHTSVIIQIFQSCVVIIYQIEMILQPAHLTRVPRFSQFSETCELMDKLLLFRYPKWTKIYVKIKRCTK